MSDFELLRRARDTGDVQSMIAEIPYARFIGLEYAPADETHRFRLPPLKQNIGNPLLPAIHGGVIGGFMEVSATLHLMLSMEALEVPRVIDFSLDYLKPGRFEEVWAQATIQRMGKRIANVAIEAWQSDPSSPIATARAHLLMG